MKKNCYSKIICFFNVLTFILVIKCFSICLLVISYNENQLFFSIFNLPVQNNETTERLDENPILYLFNLFSTPSSLGICNRNIYIVIARLKTHFFASFRVYNQNNFVWSTNTNKLFSFVIDWCKTFVLMSIFFYQHIWTKFKLYLISNIV